jgi:hypothetical protein
MYGEEEKAFQRLQEEIIKHNPDLSILAWESPLPLRRHDTDSRIYCGVLAEAPTYFAWCRGMQLFTRPPMNDFFISSDRVRIQSTIMICTPPIGQIIQYVLPTHYTKSPLLLLGVALRKVGYGQFLRSDPYRLHDMTLGHLFTCHSTHHLLFKPPIAQSALPFPFMPSRRITEEYLSRLRPKTIRFKLGPNVYRKNMFPWSRWDDQDVLFFVSDKHDDQNDWGILEFHVRPDLSDKNLSLPFIECALYTVSWGALSAPQCSVIANISYAQQVLDLRSDLSSSDQNTGALLAALVRNKIPCARSAIVDLPGTGYTIVVSIETRATEEISTWMPLDSEWEVFITCSVHKTGLAPLAQNNSEWKSRIYGMGVQSQRIASRL